MIWRRPGFPSLLVTYGTAGDLFFSGHTAIAVYGGVELVRLRGPPLPPPRGGHPGGGNPPGVRPPRPPTNGLVPPPLPAPLGPGLAHGPPPGLGPPPAPL